MLHRHTAVHWLLLNNQVILRHHRSMSSSMSMYAPARMLSLHWSPDIALLSFGDRGNETNLWWHVGDVPAL